MSEQSSIQHEDTQRSYDILCYLHEDWQTLRASAGRLRGEEYQYKYAVVALSGCWALCEFRTNGTTNYHRYASNMNDLCMFFRINARVDTILGMQRVKAALDLRLGEQTIEIVKSGASVDTALDFATKVDAAYGIDYAVHDDVRSRIFQSTVLEDE
jgi:hypothetical protein